MFALRLTISYYKSFYAFAAAAAAPNLPHRPYYKSFYAWIVPTEVPENGPTEVPENLMVDVGRTHWWTDFIFLKCIVSIHSCLAWTGESNFEPFDEKY